jgi:hypothetical protein
VSKPGEQKLLDLAAFPTRCFARRNDLFLVRVNDFFFLVRVNDLFFLVRANVFSLVRVDDFSLFRVNGASVRPRRISRNVVQSGLDFPTLISGSGFRRRFDDKDVVYLHLP